jgi:hypothetical protein
MKLITLLIIIFSLSACTKDATTPEGMLVQFSKKITLQKMSREFFYENTTGKMKKVIEDLNDEDFEKFRDLMKIKNQKITVSKKICSNDKCSLTYIIKYEQHSKEAKEFKSEVKKVASMEKIENKWLIADVSNIKTYHESVNPLVVGPDSEKTP